MTENEIRQRLLRDFGFSEDSLAIWERARGRCEYCKRDLLASKDDYFYFANIDHIWPKSRGGQDILENKALSCVTCNKIKLAETIPGTGEGIDRDAKVRAVRDWLKDGPWQDKKARFENAKELFFQLPGQTRRWENRGCRVIGFLLLVGSLLKLGQWTFG